MRLLIIKSRTGWNQRSFSQRAPFTPEKDRIDRSHHFVSGVMLRGGLIACPSSPKSKMAQPGPGHYNMERGILSSFQRKVIFNDQNTKYLIFVTSANDYIEFYSYHTWADDYTLLSYLVFAETMVCRSNISGQLSFWSQ